jgi:hypothetical protein
MSAWSPACQAPLPPPLEEIATFAVMSPHSEFVTVSRRKRRSGSQRSRSRSQRPPLTEDIFFGTAATQTLTQMIGDMEGEHFLSTPPPEAGEVDFDTHDRTIWRGSVPRDSSSAVMGSSTPRRQALAGISVTTPRSSIAVRTPLCLVAPAASIAMEPHEEFATPMARVQTKHVRVNVTLVDLSRRSYRWRLFDVPAGEAVRDVAVKARLLWGTTSLAFFTRRRRGSVKPLVADQMVRGGQNWFCCEVNSRGGDGTACPTGYPVYHLASDSSGRLRLAIPPTVGLMLRDAKCGAGVSRDHRKYLEQLDVLAAADVHGRVVAMPLPLFPPAEGGDHFLQSGIAVIHPALRPGDLVIWHQQAAPQVFCLVTRTYVLNGLAAVEVRDLASDVTFSDVSHVDLQRCP